MEKLHKNIKGYKSPAYSQWNIVYNIKKDVRRDNIISIYYMKKLLLIKKKNEVFHYFSCERNILEFIVKRM